MTRPAALFHVISGGHIVVQMENSGDARPPNLDFSDFVVQRCARESRQRRVSAEQREILPRRILRRQVRRCCTGVARRSALPIRRLRRIELHPNLRRHP
jgi:hypothetical protein